MSDFNQRELERYRRTDNEVRMEMLELGCLSRENIIAHHAYGTTKTCSKCGDDVIYSKYIASEFDKRHYFRWPEYMLRTCGKCGFDWKEAMPLLTK